MNQMIMSEREEEEMTPIHFRWTSQLPYKRSINVSNQSERQRSRYNDNDEAEEAVRHRQWSVGFVATRGAHFATNWSSTEYSGKGYRLTIRIMTGVMLVTLDIERELNLVHRYNRPMI
jgi:hypothetical protein